MPSLFITGANRGLGFEFARQYAADGWTVHGTVRSEEAGQELARQLGASVKTYVADMADIASVRRLKSALADAPIDILICNAGIYEPRDTAFGSTDYAAWEQVLRVNVLGPMATLETLSENVARSGRKLVILVSSRAGSMAETNGKEYVYASSKAALNSLAKSSSQILHERGIAVVAISPGWVRTDMGGQNANLDPAFSIASLRKLFQRLTLADSGKFLDYTGEEIPW